MTQRVWKIQRKGELSFEEIAKTVGATGHLMLRTEVAKGQTTIYFSGEGSDEHAVAFRKEATEVKMAEVTKI